MPPKKIEPKKPPTNIRTTTKKTTASSKTLTKLSGATGGKLKSGGKSPTKTSSKTKTTPQKKSKEELAAIKIQSVGRRFLAKKRLERIKKEKHDYEELIEKLQKEAWLEIIKKEREEEDRRRQKEKTERQRIAQERKLIKTFLEAAFDGEIDEIKKILTEIENVIQNNSDSNNANLARKIEKSRNKMINCEDANGNSALSEASAGGNLETVSFLLDNGAHINSIGHFHRTPLYRAAFGGHLDVLKKLLENGGDPRILDNDGILAEQIAATPEITCYLQEWDVVKTDTLLSTIQEKQDRIKLQEEVFMKEEQKRVESVIEELQVNYSNKQKIFQKLYAELNKRINEHDKCVAKGFERIDVTLQSIQDAEVDLARGQRDEEEARGKLFQAKLHLREQKSDEGNDDSRIAKCNFKELDQVLMLDVGDVVKNSGKWPLLLDSSNQAVTFLRYRDTNYINVLNPKDVESEVLRMALIGALRYGKSLVLDMLEVDMLGFLEERLNEIQENLFTDLMSKQLVPSKRYIDLIREEDGKDYLKDNFNEVRLERFQLILISKMFDPPDSWLDGFYTIRIVTQAKD